MTTYDVVTAVLAFVRMNGPIGAVVYVMGALAATLLSQGYSQDQELEADAIGARLVCGHTRALAVESNGFGRVDKSCQRVITVTAGKSDGESVKPVLRDFEHGADQGKQIPDFRARSDG